jgi:hypothetical protein
MAASAAEALVVASEFDFGGKIVSAAPYGSGHINDTFLTLVEITGQQRRFILQRINHQVFKQPDLLMENVARVCAHAHAKLSAAGTSDAHRRALRLIPTRQGKAWHVDPSGNRWRCYDFIEGATGHDVVRSPAQAEAAAKAFGAFQSLLADLPGERLHETIPDFHHTPSRFARFQAARPVRRRRAGDRLRPRPGRRGQRGRRRPPRRFAARTSHAQRHQAEQRAPR